MTKAYPLQFKAEMKEKVWGGRALEQFGLDMPDGAIGEGWMISDHPHGLTQVINGEFAGLNLEQLRTKVGQDWFGTHAKIDAATRFPLLIKLLDCNDDLSVQVHPNDDYEKLPPGELGKTEMWYVLDAKPDAKIIYGLKDNVTREQLAHALETNEVMETLKEITVSAGDTFYIPAGTVHALCSGVVVAEIQQNSDTTYRLYDYNRPGLDGQLRELHIEDSLNTIAFGDSGATYMQTNNAQPNVWLELARSPYFIVEKGIVAAPWQLTTTPESFVVLIVCAGEGKLVWADGTEELKSGQCFLLPANLGAYSLEGNCTVLRSVLP